MPPISRPFKPRARLLLQLGDQLIKNERIALFELVKNSFDADASFVKVILKQVENEKDGVIIVKDDGVGMDIDTITNVWLEPGTDSKAKQFELKKRTPRFHRLPIGEKGIGRFAAHKLGNIIELTTRKRNCPEVVVKIDWRIFEKEKYLSNVNVDIFQREPKIFCKDRTGTKIRITDLRSSWTRGMIRDAYRAVTSIINPFEMDKDSLTSHSEFKVKFECDRNDYLEGLMSSEEIKKAALWHALCVMNDNNFSMKFNFQPWLSMSNKIVARTNFIQDKILDPDDNRHPTNINLGSQRIGKIFFELFVYDRDPSILKFLDGTKKQLSDFLDNNGGVRIYRDGVRVYDYGEKGNDWLDLDLRRVNDPTTRISNNIVVGAIYLDRESSDGLIEKTNREGFVENNAFRLFRKAALFAVGKFEEERYIDKLRIRSVLGPKKAREPVYSAFNAVREKIRKKVPDPEVQHELIIQIDRAENEYKEVTQILLKSSGAGLSLSIVIHEFEKVLKELVLVVDKDETSKRIISLVHRLNRLTEGFTSLIRRDALVRNDLIEIIDQALFNIQFRFEAHQVEIISDYKRVNFNSKAKCQRNYIIMTLMNIFDNSLWWLDKKFGKENNVKRIYITLTKDLGKGTAIIIADNGPGFNIPTEYAIKPFVTRKSGGMGLGLYIADEVMKAHKGRLLFPEKGDVVLPNSMNGALVGLLFEEE